MTTLPLVHILFENEAWLEPLETGLAAEGFSFRRVKLNEGILDPSQTPAEGIWLNRLSPSSHTRGHDTTVALGREFLAWLHAHGRRVVNGQNAFELEMSKTRQDTALRRQGIVTPKTLLAIGHDHLVEAAAQFQGPFITKHNQGGKGLGIQLFHSVSAFEKYIESDAFDAGPDGKIILQQYIKPPQPYITRVEIVGGRFVLAMRSSTEQGFELCPSDACQVPSAGPDVCPADGGGSKFSQSDVTADDPLVQQYIRLCKTENIEVAGIEFVEDENGQRYTYDINGTTNYSGVFGEKIGVDGMREFARYLRSTVAPALERTKVTAA